MIYTERDIATRGKNYPIGTRFYDFFEDRKSTGVIVEPKNKNGFYTVKMDGSQFSQSMHYINIEPINN